MERHDLELASGIRKATNVSLDIGIVNEARRLGLNISRACEQGLARQIAEERGRRWLAENAEALDAANAWIDEHGLPLTKYRRF